MTEVAEAIAILDAMTQNKKENYCDHEESDRGQWKCVISGLAGTEPKPSRLLKSMKKHGKAIPDKSGLTKKSGRWDLESCSRGAFPFQTHHLIPKKHLPTHKVCTWLATKYDKHDKYQVDKDNNYDTDHANNGYNMPFVTTTYQWKQAGDDLVEQARVAQLMMDKTGIQLHQGSHSYENFGEEDEDIETEGYLTDADQLLYRVHRASLKHVKKCSICKEKDGKPKNVRPVESVVKHVDQVSRILRLKIDAGQVFVSERAFKWMLPKIR